MQNDYNLTNLHVAGINYSIQAHPQSVVKYSINTWMLIKPHYTLEVKLLNSQTNLITQSHWHLNDHNYTYGTAQII